MSEDGGGSKTRGLYILLGILCVAIVGLGVGIVIINLTPKEITNNDVNSDFIGVDITQRYKNVEITYNEAIKEFEDGINSRTGDDKIWALISYADFLYENNGDLTEIIEVLNSIDHPSGNSAAVLSYYVVLRNYYIKLGDEEMYDYYDQIVEELTPYNEKNGEMGEE